jgi:1-deoxy-D-xylulose-5-phosphate synthase
LLERIASPSDLKALTIHDLEDLARELRGKIIETVATNGGHLAPNLGTVELSIALHYVFDSPRDKMVWDVGHQAYSHKLLTGRFNVFSTLRKYGGISGFPRRKESEHDVFGTGHASTSISAALGIAKARDLKGEDYSVIAIIGDGSLTGGMAFEALNQAGHLQANLIVVLNDNEMSIAQNVGAMSAYTNRLAQKITGMPIYHQVRGDIHILLDNLPKDRPDLVQAAMRLRENALSILGPGMVFEELGFNYVGPVDGHDLRQLIETFNGVKSLSGPILVHVRTKKGKGLEIAEGNPAKYHGISPKAIDAEGEPVQANSSRTYTDVFAEAMLELGERDKRIVAVTAAMPQGTGLAKFAQKFPSRFFDVGIAEQHAVTFAAGIATQGLVPVCAIYSTFMQRAFDQVIHDVALQKLNVKLVLDRGGIVGDDGATHNGVFDLAYLRIIPNLVLAAPSGEGELRTMLSLAVEHEGPFAMRYPRCAVEGPVEEPAKLSVGKGEVVREGKDVAIIAAGTMVSRALKAAEILKAAGVDATVVNARFVKPLDRKLLVWAAKKHRVIFTVEEGVIAGGFGSAVEELLDREGVATPVKRIGFPDEFIEHGSREQMLEKYGLTAEGIASSVGQAQ